MLKQYAHGTQAHGGAVHVSGSSATAPESMALLGVLRAAGEAKWGEVAGEAGSVEGHGILVLAEWLCSMKDPEVPIPSPQQQLAEAARLMAHCPGGLTRGGFVQYCQQGIRCLARAVAAWEALSCDVCRLGPEQEPAQQVRGGGPQGGRARGG